MAASEEKQPMAIDSPKPGEQHNIGAIVAMVTYRLPTGLDVKIVD